MNPDVVAAFRTAVDRFVFWASLGDFEKAEDWALTAFGLAIVWPDPREAARA